MKNRVQRQLIYRVLWKDEILSTNIAPLSVSRHLSIWQFSVDSWRGESLRGRGQGANYKNTLLTLSTLIGRNTDAIRGLVHRNMGRGLIGWFIKASRAVLFHMKPSTVRQIGHFCSRLRFLMRTQGEKGTTLYLKSCQVLLQQSIAGYKVSDISELKIRAKRTKAGMPRIIPSGVRSRIRKGDVDSIRLWMTLLGMYRILEFRGRLNLSTITDPGVDFKESYLRAWKDFLEKFFFPTLKRVFNPGLKVELPQPQPFPILKSGPQTVMDTLREKTTTSSSFYSLVRSAKMWQQTTLKNSLKELLQLWSQHNLNGRFPPIMERLGWAASNNWHYQGSSLPEINLSSPIKDGPASGLAKLGFKEEAAGKVRVFAMVDPWTQWVMKPIHLAIFSILRGIPMDGTFDQPRPVELLRRLKVEGRTYYSIDLSAATDRLPLKLQIPIMEEVFKWAGFPSADRAAALWGELLVNREYRVSIPRDAGFDIPEDLPESVVYSVGQPMGALSSWAMLALTHHGIVQWAARRAKTNYPNAVIPLAFTEYAILGDDIVIANKFVAQEYLLILKEIGVTAGLAKSIVSKGKFYLEFAKKFFVPSGRADMLPLKEVIATLSSSLLICEFVKQHHLKLGQILSVLGYGYKTKSRAISCLYSKLNTRLRTLLVWFRSPIGCYPLPLKGWIRSSGFNSFWDVPDDHVAWQYIWEALMVEVQLLMNRYYDAAEKFRSQAESAGALRPSENMLVKGIPISRHPPYLKEVLVRDDTVNQFVTERLPFSALLAPIGYDLHASAEGKGDSVLSLLGFSSDASAFNAKYGVADEIDVPSVTMPESLVNADLFEQVFAINDESLKEKLFSTKCEELTRWIFDFDKLAQDIPTSYWPQVRAGEKNMREFIQTAKIHRIFYTVFGAFGLNPRSNPAITSWLCGNTLDPELKYSYSKCLALVASPRVLSLVPIFGTWCAHDATFLTGSDALKLLKSQWLVHKGKLSEFFTSHDRPVIRSRWLWFVKGAADYLRDFIILASLVWFIPLDTSGPPIPELLTGSESLSSSGYLGILSYGFLMTIIAALIVILVRQSNAYTDLEWSSVDLLSRQSQQISELEFRLIRMIAEREDMEDIIQGLESTIGVLGG